MMSSENIQTCHVQLNVDISFGLLVGVCVLFPPLVYPCGNFNISMVLAVDESRDVMSSAYDWWYEDGDE